MYQTLPARPGIPRVLGVQRVVISGGLRFEPCPLDATLPQSGVSGLLGDHERMQLVSLLRVVVVKRAALSRPPCGCGQREFGSAAFPGVRVVPQVARVRPSGRPAGRASGCHRLAVAVRRFTSTSSAARRATHIPSSRAIAAPFLEPDLSAGRGPQPHCSGLA